MKKLTALLLALVMLVCFAACSASKIEPYEGDVSALIASIYEKQGLKFMVGEATPVDLTNAWSVQNYLGLGAVEENLPAAEETAAAEDGVAPAAAVAEEAAPAAAEESAPAAESTPAEEDTAPAAMPEETTEALAADFGIKEAYFSESMIGQAYSLVVARVDNPTEEKVEEIKKAMFEGINTRKWICVEADTLRVVSYKDVVMLVMAASNLGDGIADGMVKAFAEAVSGAEVTDVAAVLTGEILTKG